MLKVNTCYGRVDSELLSRLSSIKLLAFDVDGTITDLVSENSNNKNVVNVTLPKYSTGFIVAFK